MLADTNLINGLFDVWVILFYKNGYEIESFIAILVMQF